MDIYYFGLIVWCTFESVLSTAAIFGWAQLLEILENERYFSSYCGNRDFNNTLQLNTSNTLPNGDTSSTCSKQDSVLQLVYTLCVFTCFASIFVSGKFLDTYGFRKTRILTCFIYLLAGGAMLLSTYDIHEMLFPGLLLTVMGGGCYMSVLVKVCGVFPRRRYVAMSVINGAIDSSAVMLLIFKLCYNAGVSFKYIIIVYYSFVVAHGLLFTFTIFPRDLSDSTANNVGNSVLTKRQHSTSNDTGSKSFTTDKKEIFISNEDVKNLDVLTLSGDTQQDDLEIEEKGDVHHSAVGEKSNAERKRLLPIFRTPKFVIHTCFVSITTLRSFFFTGTINTLLKDLTDDEEKVDLYLTILGLIQFSGIVLAFVPGFLLEWAPVGRHRNFSIIISFILTGCISILLTVGVLIPSLKLQIVNFFLYTIMRSFLYSTHGSFILKEFPLYHVGALFGFCLLVSAVVSLFQIPMFALMEGPYDGDPAWVNVGLLVFQILVMVHPLYLWKCSKDEKRKSSNNQFIIKNTQASSNGDTKL